jgi:hypothetical protein
VHESARVCTSERAFVTSANNARAHKHVKLLPGDTKVRGKKIHLFRMDGPRSPKAYIFGNSLALFQSFLGHSTSASRRNTWQALDIFSAVLEGTFRAPHPAALIGAKEMRLSYRIIVDAMSMQCRRRSGEFSPAFSFPFVLGFDIPSHRRDARHQNRVITCAN